MRTRTTMISLYMLLAIGAAGCAQQAAVTRPVAALPSDTPAALPPPAAAEPAPVTQAPLDTQRDYVVGPGDVLRINVYQNADLSLDARVSESGLITYPLLGQVAVGGQSIGQVEATLADGLKKGNFIKQPQVGVLLVQVRGNQASVLGMATRPGRYPIEVNGMRLSQLLALAGGVAPGGSEIVTLSGVRDGQPYRLKVDISALFTGGTPLDDPLVLNGDTLYVERAPTVYIYGEVQRPGPIPLQGDMTLMQAVASGGGLTPRGTERGMRIHRRNAAGKLEVISPRMEDIVHSGDVIYVKESLF
ncbi:polysaccharide export protein EpsE [Sphaerotilaceae bacterium SBD11-9]